MPKGPFQSLFHTPSSPGASEARRRTGASPGHTDKSQQSLGSHILVNIMAFDPIDSSLKDAVFSSSHFPLINEKAEVQQGAWLAKVTQQV